MTYENLKCTISGSFKYKPEIDTAIQEFRDFGVEVLAPEEGWFMLPKHKLLTISANREQSFRPLPNERHMTIGAVEDNFLWCVLRSHFLYVVNPEGYIGLSTSLEIGFAIAHGIRVILSNPINLELDQDMNLNLERKALLASLPVMTIDKLMQDLNQINTE